MVDYLNSQKGDTMDEQSNVPADNIDASIADINLTDPNVDLSASTNTDDTAAPTGTEEAAAPTDDKPADDAKDTTKEPDAETTPAENNESDATDAPAQPQPQTPEERELAARQAWRERENARQQVAQQLDQTYGPKSEQQLLEEGYDPNQASIEALRQEIAYTQERTRIAELNANMRAEAVEITRDFPIFDPNNPAYDEQFAVQVREGFQREARLQADENNTILNADSSLYDYYQRAYNTLQRGISLGAQQKQQDVQSMMARTENPGGSSSTNAPAAGSLEELEARIGDVVIT